MGPVVYMSTKRYESKHREFKKIIARAPNFINLCKSLAIRHQQHISISDFGLKDHISHGVKRPITNNDCFARENLLNEFGNQMIEEAEHFHFNDYDYMNGYFVFNYDEIWRIKKLLIIFGKVYFSCQQYELVKFIPFFNSYKINLILPLQEKIPEFGRLKYPKPYEARTFGDEEFIIAETLDVRKCFVQ